MNGRGERGPWDDDVAPCWFELRATMSASRPDREFNVVGGIRTER